MPGDLGARIGQRGSLGEQGVERILDGLGVGGELSEQTVKVNAGNLADRAA